MSEIKQVHHHTPTLEAHDARGVPVRQVAWHRAEALRPAQRRVHLTRLDPAGQHRQQWDPRLFERLAPRESLAPSQQAITSLCGTALFNESRDAGWQLTLPGDAGQVRERWDSRNSHWKTDYDALLRPVRIRECASDLAERTAEHFTWSEVTGDNQRGRLVRHDDDAGTRLIDSYSLAGAARSETRHFLHLLDLPDWPELPADRDALLEPAAAAQTVFRHSPLGEVLTQTDALGNRQHSRFNLSGELAAVHLELAEGTNYPLLANAHYNAFGQIETQTAGNGVISQAEYDPADGRLQRLIARRPGRATLQDLLYAYDRVGNVIRIEDLSQPVRHFANQRVDPVSTFAYDSLYQLHEATGREAAGALIGPQLPDLAPDPGDTSRLLNYRQLYDYDASGNLLSLRHTGQQSYTRSMTVDENSNRAVAEPGDPLAAFDANGNLLVLQPGQPLHWNARNQLHSTRQVVRESAEDDEEYYRYGGDGLRVRKVLNRLVSGRMQQSETRYLPGLELHIRAGERFAVLTTQAGRYAVRCLHWSEGPPEGIATPQLRYSLDDLHGSSGLELDGEARILSHEGFYPFGGTAWWAANSAIEASYKSHRYSGKERDGSGLYDYGLRYYAPWLARWINPDPAGDVDGLNRYRFVRNNPLTLADRLGLNSHYTVENFSKGPKKPAPDPALTGLRDTGMSLHGRRARSADFAYNTNWTVRSLYHDGAINQAGDILRSNFAAVVKGVIMRQITEQMPFNSERIAHALAAEAGLCDEFGYTSGMLMAASPDWPNEPIHVVGQPEHRSALLGDPRVSDAIVVDPWVNLPTVHLWSHSLNSVGSPELENFTPRMPGAPDHAISRERVLELRAQHYSTLPVVPQRALEQQLFDSLRGGATWTQASSMQEPQPVFYRLDGELHDATAIPEALYDDTFRSLDHAARIRNDARFRDLLPRL